ncbi:hypothetical protein BJV82DRAFT_663435 [Fennellomyces sp. T-0311]|nr:hypothetical protein BJV82DRAFT_663435 [Fennellomyces sp. T-0311]
MNSIKTANVIVDKVDLETGRQCILSNDIGLVAADILQDPIEKHDDAVYEMIGDIVPMKDCAGLLIKALGREISYIRATLVDMYHRTIEKCFPLILAYDFPMYLRIPNQVTSGLSILIGREPVTLAQWFGGKQDHPH